jgi:hypothetical protein
MFPLQRPFDGVISSPCQISTAAFSAASYCTHEAGEQDDLAF